MKNNLYLSPNFLRIIVWMMDSVITIASNLDTCCTVIREIMKHFDKVRNITLLLNW